MEKIPAPKGDPDKPLKALIFDSYYDNYKGVVILARIFSGAVRKGDTIRMMNTGTVHEVTEVGTYSPGHVHGDRITVCEGEGIFINVGQLHEALNHPGSSGRYLCVDFHPELISGSAVSIIRSLYVRPYITENSLPYLKIDSSDVIISELLELAGIYEKKENGYEIDIEILLLGIWKKIIISMSPAETDEEPDGGQERIKEIIRWVDAHYMYQRRRFV